MPQSADGCFKRIPQTPPQARKYCFNASIGRWVLQALQQAHERVDGGVSMPQSADGCFKRNGDHVNEHGALRFNASIGRWVLQAHLVRLRCGFEELFQCLNRQMGASSLLQRFFNRRQRHVSMPQSADGCFKPHLPSTITGQSSCFNASIGRWVLQALRDDAMLSVAESFNASIGRWVLQALVTELGQGLSSGFNASIGRWVLQAVCSECVLSCMIRFQCLNRQMGASSLSLRQMESSSIFVSMPQSADGCFKQAATSMSMKHGDVFQCLNRQMGASSIDSGDSDTPSTNRFNASIGRWVLQADLGAYPIGTCCCFNASIGRWVLQACAPTMGP